jgi:group II intron reverse transcriptase/maturase
MNNNNSNIKVMQYKNLISIENLKKGLARTKNNVSPGLDGEIKKQITENRLIKLHNDLSSQKYNPTPSKKVGIPRPGGGTRYLGISSQIDKVVQGAILNELESIFEPIFLDVSYGSRKNINCHDALKKIKYGWKGVTWVINVDIEKCFDRVNHEILLKKLNTYCDQSTLELIRKLLKAGYVDVHNLNDRSEYNVMGIPQGSLISPIMNNILLHELDEYVTKEIIPTYNRGKARKKNAEYSKRYTLSDLDKQIVKKYPSIKKALMRIKHNSVAKGNKFTAMDGFDSDFRRCHYVRYVDDFIIGFTGPRVEAQQIFKLVSDKLGELKFDVNHEKSKIYHSNERNIKYLGVYIRYFSHHKLKWRKDGTSTDEITKQVPALQAQAINTVHFRVPIDKLLSKLVDKGLAKSRKDGTVRATAYLKYCMLEDEKIVRRYSAMIRGLLNYYSCINRRSDLWKVFAILRKSCALTLAHKHKIHTAARVYAKYGPNLIIRNLGKEVASLFYPKSLKTKIDFKTRRGVNLHPSILEIEIDKIPGSTKTNLKTLNICEYEGCDNMENLEAHHINPMSSIAKRKDLSTFEKALLRRKRKVVMLCKKHHNLLHRKRIFEDKTKKNEDNS